MAVVATLENGDYNWKKALFLYCAKTYCGNCMVFSARCSQYDGNQGTYICPDCGNTVVIGDDECEERRRRSTMVVSFDFSRLRRFLLLTHSGGATRSHVLRYLTETFGKDDTDVKYNLTEIYRDLKVGHYFHEDYQLFQILEKFMRKEKETANLASMHALRMLVVDHYSL